MVLADLGSKLTAALHKMQRSTVIDDVVIKQMLKEFAMALMQADVDIRLVQSKVCPVHC